MTEREALLAAIRANPEEDTPRLAFADWLDEHEPDPRPKKQSRGRKAEAPSAWASLIRTECELAQLENDGSASAALYRFFRAKDEQAIAGVRWERADPGVARRIELQNLANKLRPAAKALRAGLPKLTLAKFGAGWDGDTYRGFPGGVHVRFHTRFVQQAPKLSAAAPALRVTFDLYALPPTPAPGTWMTPEVLSWCREIDLDANGYGGAELFAAMSALSEAAGVRTLRFRSGSTENMTRILERLATAPHWSGLRELDIYAAFGPPAGLIENTLRAPHLRGLRRLRVQGGNVGEVITAVGGMAELNDLALPTAALDDAGAIRLANTPLPRLRALDVQNNQIGGAGASALIAAPNLPALAVLDLDNNPIRGLDRPALAGAPAGGLRTIGFHNARLTVQDVTALTTSPRLSELLYFDADYNGLAESAVARLVKGFGTRAPAILYLMVNGIGDAGVEALTNWPAAAQIDMLHLSGNLLPTAAAKAIAGCAHLKGLQHLCAGVEHPAGGKALKACFGRRAFV